MQQPYYPKNLEILKVKVRVEQTQLASFRRKLSTLQIPERAYIGKKTFYQIEKGVPIISTWYMVLFTSHFPFHISHFVIRNIDRWLLNFDLYLFILRDS